MTERHEQVTEWTVLPAGCPPDHPEARNFTVRVVWRGEYRGRSGGGWAVTRLGSEELSRAGHWTYFVPRYRRWQHRWETFEEAQKMARLAVDDVLCAGRTWAAWRTEWEVTSD